MHTFKKLVGATVVVGAISAAVYGLSKAFGRLSDDYGRSDYDTYSYGHLDPERTGSSPGRSPKAFAGDSPSDFTMASEVQTVHTGTATVSCYLLLRRRFAIFLNLECLLLTNQIFNTNFNISHTHDIILQGYHDNGRGYS